MRQWIADIIRQREVAAIPVMTHPGIEHNGHTVRQAVSDGRIHYEAVMKLNEMYPNAAACTIMDLTAEAEAFGAQITFSDDAVPAVANRLLSDAKSIYDLQLPSLSAGRIPQYLKANLLAAKAMNNSQKPLFAGCIGPFSLAGRLYDMSDIMVLIYENPDAAHDWCQRCPHGRARSRTTVERRLYDIFIAIRKTYRQSCAGRQLYRCTAQLWQSGALHPCNGSYRCCRLPFWQQVPHGGCHP